MVSEAGYELAFAWPEAEPRTQPTTQLAGTAAPKPTKPVPLSAPRPLESGTPPPAAPPPAPRPLEPSETLVIWTGALEAVMTTAREAEKAAAQSVTRFVSADSRVVASRPGLYMAIGQDLLRWTTRMRTAPSSGCTEIDPNLKVPYPHRKLREAVLVSVRSGKQHVAVGFLKADPEELPYVEQHTPIAIYGETLFVRSDREFFSCGVHPQYAAEFRVLRLASDGLHALETTELLRAGSIRMPHAEAKLTEDAVSEGYGNSADDLATTMVFPEFGENGRTWVAQYSAFAPWAYSDGFWSGYTRSARLELSVVPPTLSSMGTVPEALVRYLRAHPKERVYGYSIGRALPAPYGPGG
jgi:hypothetical protein